jgi:hypothetical protein
MHWKQRTRTDALIDELAQHIECTLNAPDIDPRANRRYLSQAALSNYTAGLMQPLYARLFKGMSEMDIDHVLSAFAFENCHPNTALVDIIKQHTGVLV